jgi:raffinose/stachyose/melibiose transport system permease protein
MSTISAPTHAEPPEEHGFRKAFVKNQGFLYLVPALVLFTIFVLYPIFYIFGASLTEWSGLGAKEYIGLDNYEKLFSGDRAFNLAIRNSVYWTFLTIFPQMFIGFILAYILNSGIPFQNVFRAIFYMPAIISPVVVSIVWQRIYNPFGGLLSDIGFEHNIDFLIKPYLSDPDIAIFSVIAINVWQWTGFSMLMYIAGLQTLSNEMIEAAKVDGANVFQLIGRIIWPMLRHVHLMLILLGVIGTLQTFALIFMLTKGGPNHSTEMLPNYIFQQAFELNRMGYASAIAVVLMVIALSTSIFQVKVFGSRFAITQ